MTIWQNVKSGIGYALLSMVSASLLCASPAEEVQQATVLAIEGRPASYLHALSDHGFASLRAEQRQHERSVLKRVREQLTDYSQGNLRESVTYFLQQTLDVSPVSMVEIPSKRPKETTFIAFDGQQEFYIRVFASEKEKEEITPLDTSKAYRARDSHFIRQLTAADLMKSLQLTHALPLEPLAVGFCTIEDSYHYFVAGVNVPGKNLQLLHAEIFKHPEGSEQRAHAISIFKCALTNLAITLGTMHSKNATPIKLTPEALSAFQTRINAKLKACQEAGETEEYIENIRKVVQRQLVALAESSSYLTYYHGYAMLKKFFYDEESDKIAMKELYAAHSSMGRNGEPLGCFAGHDVHSVLEEIRFETLRFEGGTPASLTEELCETFLTAYRHTVGDFEQPALLQLEQSLRRLERYPGSLSQTDDPVKQKSLALCRQLFQ